MDNPLLVRSAPIFLGKTKQQSRLQRVAGEALTRFRLTLRDKEIIEMVYRYRAVNAPQIAALFFSSPRQNGFAVNARCKHRLRMLYHHGYLFRDEQPTKLAEGRKPLVYFLDRRGKEFLSELLGTAIEWVPKDNNVTHLFLQHLLATNDVRVSFTLSARRHKWTIQKWLDDKTLKSPQMKDTVTITGKAGGIRHAAVVPDGYARLETNEDIYNFFFEIDRGTVTGETWKEGKRDWARKVRAYLEYYRSGAYQRRYKTSDMRILTITTGERRLSHLKRITEVVGGKARFWFATFDAVKTDDILAAPIWKVASREGLFSLI